MTLVDDGYELDGVLTVEPAPGHTLGPVCIRISSEGKRAYCSGDIFHHPLQIHHPELYTGFDADQALGIDPRRRSLSVCAEENALLLPTHFAEPHACFVRPCGGGYVAEFDGLNLAGEPGNSAPFTGGRTIP